MIKKERKILQSSTELPSINHFIENNFRVLSLFGDLNEAEVAAICHSLLFLKESGIEVILEDPEDPESAIKDILYEPFDFYISTWGGDALGMFAVYDIMRMIRKKCEINTYAIGKVMSAGILLFAAGTKGNRKIGKNTRIMFHGIAASHHGSIYSLENEMKETKWIQKQYINALISETKMTRQDIKDLLEKQMDVYFDAKEAVRLGIADLIV